MLDGLSLPNLVCFSLFSNNLHLSDCHSLAELKLVLACIAKCAPKTSLLNLQGNPLVDACVEAEIAGNSNLLELED